MADFLRRKDDHRSARGWVFGFWGVVSPAIALVKVRRLFRAIERAGSRAELVIALRSEETRDAAIDLIASEHKIPRFVAKRVYRMLVSRLPLMGNGAE